MTVLLADPHNAEPIWSPNRYVNAATDCRWLVIHTQQGRSTARGLAGYCKNPASEVSYHDAIDAIEMIQMVRYQDAPWSAGGANTVAEHMCFGGSFAEWTRAQWLDPDKDADGINQDAMLWRGAAWGAWRAQVNEIPVQWVTNGVPPGSRGFTGHSNLGQWGGGHSDPGPGFPTDIYIERVQSLINGNTGTQWDEVMRELIG